MALRVLWQFPNTITFLLPSKAHVQILDCYIPIKMEMMGSWAISQVLFHPKQYKYKQIP